MKRLLRNTMLVLGICSITSGCAGLSTLSSAAEPTDLYVLTPKSTFSTSLPRLRQQIVVSEPTATAAISSDRIAVQPTPLQVEFLPGVRWVDTAPAIIQTLLIESYENTNKVEAVGRSAVSLRADYVIVTDLREFQALLPPDAAAQDPLSVNVRLNMKIVDAEADRIIASKSFNEVTQAPSDGADDIASAFDVALGRVLRKSVEWSIPRMHNHSMQVQQASITGE